MGINSLKENTAHIKKIIREMYIFTNQLDLIKNLEKDKNVVINTKEKILLNQAVASLANQLKILNKSTPELINTIGFYKKLSGKDVEIKKYDKNKKLIKVKYDSDEKDKISLTISEKNKKEFLENLSKSNLSINQLKRKYSIKQKLPTAFGKPNFYAKMSNRFFRNYSSKLISKGYFNKLNRDLRKISSPFVTGTYVSMIFFTVFLTFIVSIFLFIFLLFFKISILVPFFSIVEENISIRAVKVLWIIFAFPIISGFLFYLYPYTEGKNIGSKINQELPFVVIHMSAISSSGLEPLNIFNILLKSGEYKYTSIEIRKIINLVNFHGKDLVTALKLTSKSSPSSKLRELLDGLATSITSGGDLYQFLDKHADSLLFDYKLERERYTKASETFMDIYISIVIAAPMILLMLFVIMGSTGLLGGFLGLSVNAVSLLIILAIAMLNIGFLIFLKLKQPVI